MLVLSVLNEVSGVHVNNLESLINELIWLIEQVFIISV